MACALEGEAPRRRIGARRQHRARRSTAASCSSAHANPPDIVRLPVPAGLTAVVVHPGSRDRNGAGAGAARARRCRSPTRSSSGRISARSSTALHRGDFDADLARSLEDTIAEPRRAPLVPGLAAIKRAAVDAGALGCSLSGSGPSLFALCRGRGSAAPRGGGDDRAPCSAHIGGEPQTYVSPIAPQRRARRLIMRFVTTRAGHGVRRRSRSRTALFDGLAPDGGLYVPETIEPWPPTRSRGCRAAR